MRDLSAPHHLFIKSFLYNQYGLMNIYFICWFIIQYCFIYFDVQMLTLWPLGTLSVLLWYNFILCVCVCLNTYFMTVQVAMGSSFTILASVLKSALVLFYGDWCRKPRSGCAYFYRC